MSNDVADLEITLYPREAGAYTAELRYTAPNSEATAGAGTAGVVHLDMDALRAAEHEPATYATLLSDALYGTPAFRQAVAETMAIAASQDADLRVRLSVSSLAPELHGVRWELLRDPDGNPLALGETVRFSRFVTSRDWRQVSLRAFDQVRALIAVAAPAGIETFGLAAIDVEGEVARAREALGDIPVAALVGEGRATLEAIVAALRDGLDDHESFDILYLVAHGGLDEGEPVVWLDSAATPLRPASGADLAQRISELRQRPRLVVLASCESAGTGTTADGAPLTALGPRLTDVGVPAVIAMQGKISIETAQAFMARFFSHLSETGALDQAVAVARGEVRDRDDHYMPVLFSRLRGGQIWYRPGFGEQRTFQQWPKILSNITTSKCTPILGPGLAESIIGSPREIATDWAAEYNFPLAPHQREELASVAQFLSVSQEPAFPHTTLLASLRHTLIKRYSLDLDPADTPLPDVFAAISAALRARKQHDPHQILAELPFPVYVTTAIDTLLEEALRAAGKEPQVELLRWNEYVEGEPSIFEEDPSYKPSKDKPLVFHLFGSVTNDASLVLTEDDYFDYLIGATRNRELIPTAVRGALVDRALLFLGFRLEDWSFRVLFRSLMSDEGGKRRQRYTNIAGQLIPEEGRFLSPGGVSSYLERYFNDANIDIFWGAADDFTRQLQQQWAKTKK